jgi:hypothetical protein
VAILLVLAMFGQARASFTWQGGDWAGRDFAPGNGDVLIGTFTDIGRFTVIAGEAIYAGSSLLSITSQQTEIDGTLYGGAALPTLDIASVTTITISGVLDQWHSVNLTAGSSIVLTGSIGTVSSSGSTGVLAPIAGGSLMITGSGGDAGSVAVSPAGLLMGPDSVMIVGNPSITLNDAPLPPAILLFVSGLAGLSVLGKKRTSAPRQ